MKVRDQGRPSIPRAPPPPSLSLYPQPRRQPQYGDRFIARHVEPIVNQGVLSATAIGPRLCRRPAAAMADRSSGSEGSGRPRARELPATDPSGTVAVRDRYDHRLGQGNGGRGMSGLADGPQFRSCLGRNLIDRPLAGGHGSIQDATEATDKGGDEGSRPGPSEHSAIAAPTSLSLYPEPRRPPR